MPDLWMPGAERHDVGDHAPCDATYPPKAIAHITWDKNATASAPADHISFESLVTYFTGSGAGNAPHLIWDPFTGQIAQLFPADSRSKSVVDAPGGTRTNRAGAVVIQIEAVYFPYTRWNGTVYPRLVDTPCRGWPQLHAWVRSWGVPDTWPMGRPVDFTSNRDEHIWETRGGWYGHQQVPENDHQDPGSWPNFTTTEDDMTPEEHAWLKNLNDNVGFMVWSYKNARGQDAYADLGAAATPRTILAYRNPDEDKASVDAGKGHIPDVYGHITGTSSGVTGLVAQVGALTAAVAALSAQGGLTAEQVTAAAQAGAQAALAELGGALTHPHA